MVCVAFEARGRFECVGGKGELTKIFGTDDLFVSIFERNKLCFFIIFRKNSGNFFCTIHTRIGLTQNKYYLWIS